jgi:5-methylcytosine-specific restriction protein A
MDAYLLTWKPSEWGYDHLLDYIKSFEQGQTTLRWSCGTSKKIPVGSQVFLTKQGKGQRGVFGSGVTVSKPFESPHYNDKLRNLGKTACYVNVDFDSLYDPRTQIKVGFDQLVELHPTIWNSQGSGKKIPFDAAASLAKIWLERTGAALPHFPDELEDSNEHYEGARRTVTVNLYERDPEVRRKCVAEWGTTCSVCSFHFEYFYGPLGKEYIHVHHLKPLGEIGQEYKVDPVNDLRPVCPNCHAMLHRRKPALSIEELRGLIADYGKRIGS